MYNILHITTHMGGGIGKVLSGISSHSKNNGSKYIHKILLLEKPEKMNFIDMCIKNNIEIIITDSYDEILNQMKKVDIIQLEWWHHPKFAKFLNEFPSIEARLIIWAHISGCSYPYIPFEFIKIPSKFIFTSKYSYDNPLWTKEEKEYVKLNTSMVNSCGGFENLKNKDIKNHTGFNVGYIGTLSYSKLNPNFAEYYKSIKDMNLNFIMVGDLENIDKITEDLKKHSIYKQVKLKPYVNDVSEELQNFDIFSYLLNENHFGTTENILLEAMAIGLPIVAINQCAEKFLIKHMYNGILVNSIDEYKKAINYLLNNPKERTRIGNNAKKNIRNNFSIDNTVENLNLVYDEVIKLDKKKYNFKDVFGDKPYEWFLACMGNKKEYFEESIKGNYYILREQNKSSISQFIKYYPEDEYLKKIKMIIEKH